MHNVSLIVSTYNSHDILDLVLHSISKQVISTPVNLEIIIADDGSDLLTLKLVKSWKIRLTHKVKHVWHKDNGFRKAEIKNKAIKQATGDYLIFIDGDCLVPVDFIEQHINLAQKGFFVAGNRALLSESMTQKIISNKYNYADIFKSGILGLLKLTLQNSINKITINFRVKYSPWRYLRSQNWKYPKGCNYGLYKNDLLDVNGMDQSFTGWGHEDSDLFIRLIHNGLRIKDGRFATGVLHLWHKENDRSRASSNFAEVQNRLSDPKFTQAVIGIRELVN